MLSQQGLRQGSACAGGLLALLPRLLPADERQRGESLELAL